MEDLNDLKRRANDGYPEAQRELGEYYYTIKNYDNAVKWYQKSAEQGNAKAQYQLGCCYFDGKGVKKDKHIAEKWFLKAAEKGLDVAKINLRFIYGNVKGAEDEDIKEKNREYRWNLIMSTVYMFLRFLCGCAVLMCFGWLVAFLFDIHDSGVVINYADKRAYIFLSSCGCIVSILAGVLCNNKYRSLLKTSNSLLTEIAELKIEKDRKAAENGDKEAEARLNANKKRKSIDDIVSELNGDKITEEHSRAKIWYSLCLGIMGILLVGFALYMRWNVMTISRYADWQETLVRVLISMSFLSMIFILMNQAARSRKTMVLLSKEIQEYKYIGALLKGKVGLFPDNDEIDKSIDKTLDDMIKLHLYIQRKRLEKEDHTEVKDITPEVLNFFKENTSSIMGSYNETFKTKLDMQKTIDSNNMELQKTIIQNNTELQKYYMEMQRAIMEMQNDKKGKKK